MGEKSLDKYTFWLLYAKYSFSSSFPTQTTVLDTRTYTCSFSRDSKLFWVEKGEKGSSV